jgi:hypothetical protein
MELPSLYKKHGHTDVDESFSHSQKATMHVPVLTLKGMQTSDGFT